jgi:Flp pilus assembly protein TadD
MPTSRNSFAQLSCAALVVHHDRSGSRIVRALAGGIGLKRIILAGLWFTAAGCQSTQSPVTNDAPGLQFNQARAESLGKEARDEFDSGSFDKCQATLDEALRLAPGSAGLHIQTAKLNIEQGQLESAEKQLKEAGKISPGNGEIDYLLGVVFQRRQQPQKAYVAYDAAVRKNPGELSYLMAKSEMLVTLDRSVEALDMLKDKLASFEHSAALRDTAGQLLLEQNRYAEAADILREASILAADDQTIRQHLAFALYYARQYSAADEVFTRLLKDTAFTKRADIYAALGECQSRSGRLRDARQSLQNAVELEPNSTEYWLSLGRITTQMGDLPRAELAVRKALSIQPNSADAQCLLGYVRLRENRLTDALSAFRTADQIDPTDTVSLCMQGYVLGKLGKSDEAVLLFAKALKLNPDDELASRLMASADLRDGN